MEFTDLLGLEGKGVLVTGAARGIGRAVAQAFDACGSRLFLVDVDEVGLDETVGLLSHAGQHRARVADLRVISALEDLVAEAVEFVGQLACVAHVAAVLRRRMDIDDVTEDDWDFQMDLNLKSTFFLNRAAANAMIAYGSGGSIVNFSSQGWWTGGLGGSVVYNTSKGGITTMTRGLARTYAEAGVRVNAVAPGFVDTPLMRDGSLTDDQISAQVALVPMGRLALPDEVAGSVVFLGSDQARYITGATINVSGGFLMY
jgi:NAD(P)-dependent dehydrogenase (short-subunit alcohol dehydrogenase family)